VGAVVVAGEPVTRSLLCVVRSGVWVLVLRRACLFPYLYAGAFFVCLVAVRGPELDSDVCFLKAIFYLLLAAING
jgi:hypothetical protein